MEKDAWPTAECTRRAALLVDGGHLQDCLSALGGDIDFRKLPTAFAKSGRVVRSIYFPSEVAHPETYAGRLATWLVYNGYDVEMPGYWAHDRGREGHVRPSAVRILLAIRALKIARSVDTIIMIAGDEHYSALVSGLQQIGRKVVTVSTLRSSPRLIANPLRRQADDFIDLGDLMPTVRRPISASGDQVTP